MSPLQPDECAAMARRAASLVDSAALFFFPGSGIHRMYHDTGAVTIHVYSPPLRAIGYYEVVDGLLQRTPGPPDETSPESPRLLESLAAADV
jgi:hypothetical protein